MVDENIWEELKEKLPWHKNEEERQMRIKLWNEFNVNGNQYLSLAEVDKGMRDVVCLPTLFDTKPVLIRAFNAAKNAKKAGKDKRDDDYVTKGEFRLLLKFLRQYFEYWVAFDRIDSDDDRRISFDEFVQATDKMEAWGIDMSDPGAQWSEADRDGGGKILFVEFVDWAIKKNLDLEDDDDDDDQE